ncbi:MAG: pyruvate kinase [Bacteroidetes bacterium]|nr:pyruvate kinase [Bacteroidota bacterium]
MIRKTKIIATIGPATSSKEMLKALIQKGVTVCRLNFSHLSHEKAKEIISSIKEINQELHVHTAILADLQGPKIRVGDFEKPINLKKGAEIVFCSKKKKGTIYIDYNDFAKDVKPKDRVLLDDGKLSLEVVSTNKRDTVVLKVVFGGFLHSRKGVNLPNTAISLPCLTKKDMNDLEFILTQKIEWVGLSFVRKAQDVKDLKQIINSSNSLHKVIAKIEKPEAIKNIDSIIEASDAIMVARGDLGVEAPPQKVPVYQKMIVNKCIANSKPVIIATQMLESMTNNSTATRAEVNDVANSVIDGADALMLSGETSVGKHPLKVVDTMRNIIRDIESSEHSISKNTEVRELKDDGRFLTNAICLNAVHIAKQTKAKAIITITYSGFNTIKVSSFRPQAFIYAFTNNHAILNTLSLVWGVQGFYYEGASTTSQTIKETKEILKKQKYLRKGDLVVNIASMPARERGTTNMMKISKI